MQCILRVSDLKKIQWVGRGVVSSCIDKGFLAQPGVDCTVVGVCVPVCVCVCML